MLDEDAVRLLAGLSLPEPPASQAAAAGSAAAAAGGAASQGLGARRKIRKRSSPVRLKVVAVVGIKPPGLPRTAVSGRRTKLAAQQQWLSAFVGVSWLKHSGRWQARVSHDDKNHHLGSFDDEEEAARAFDAPARRLRPKGKAHGGRAGASTNWQRLNFPTAAEEAFAKGEGMPPHLVRAGLSKV